MNEDTEYVPTTDLVSRAYMLFRQQEDPSLKSDPDNAEALDEFYRWRERHVKQAVAEERAKNVAIIRERKQTLELRAQSFYHKHRTVGGDSLSDQALALDWVAKEIEAGEHDEQ